MITDTDCENINDWEKRIKMFDSTASVVNCKMTAGAGNESVIIAGTLVVSCLMEAEKISRLESLGADRFKRAIEALKPIMTLSAAGSIPGDIYYSACRLSESYLKDWTAFRREKEFMTEKEIQNIIIEKWSTSILSKYSLVGTEVKTSDGDRIDILAKDATGRIVIIELKKFNKNGYKQLRSYATGYEGNPILINISEDIVANKKKGIVYYTFAELHGKSEVISKQLLINDDTV